VNKVEYNIIYLHLICSCHTQLIT